MNKAIHAMTVNGRIHGEIKDRFDSPEMQIRKSLSLLDGSRRFSLMLWAIPDGVSFGKVDLGSEPKEFVQAAGSRERMTVEARRIEAGQSKQYVVGRAAPYGDEEHEAEVISWDGVETTVRPCEVFTADESTDVFISYYSTGWIPDTYTLRLFDM